MSDQKEKITVVLSDDELLRFDEFCRWTVQDGKNPADSLDEAAKNLMYNEGYPFGDAGSLEEKWQYIRRYHQLVIERRKQIGDLIDGYITALSHTQDNGEGLGGVLEIIKTKIDYRVIQDGIEIAQKGLLGSSNREVERIRKGIGILEKYGVLEQLKKEK